MSVLDRRPLLRWLVPAGVATVILATGAVTSAMSASADTGLPSRSAAQLLVDLQSNRLSTWSGTVVEHADLGLPALPGGSGGDGSPQFSSLIDGAHTLRVWTDGLTHQRVALIGALGESDLIHNGQDLWAWSSEDNTAVHATLPAPSASKPTPSGSLPSGLTPQDLTPQSIAAFLIAAATPTTSITSGTPSRVAGRPAYELVIAPKDASSLVGSARIAIDSARHIPLQVQIYAAGATKPAFEIGYTEISFTRPSAAVFRFNPPPGAKVTPAKPPTTLPTKPDAHTIGSDWSTVVTTTVNLKNESALLSGLPTVTGPWGSGKLVSTTLVTALITTDGHVYAGAITPGALIAAVTAATK
jgi:outer membrane lipoprotein-sorting protein